MNIQQAAELIKRYNQGQASAQERKLVANWFAKESAQKQEQPMELHYLEVKERVWVKITRQSLPVKKAALWPRIWIAAAVAAVVLIAGLFYFNPKKTDTAQTHLSLNIIKPGGNKAILTLGNGTKISLSDASMGQVAAQSGVRISKTANGQLVYDASAASRTEGKTEYNTVETPAGGQWQVKLPDGSLVFLNALSSITYPARFNGNERRIKMLGEAYFEIAHNKAKPFRVESRGQTVEVLGTHFNIMAYADEKVVKTTLLEGSVKILDNGREELLRPGQQAQVSEGRIMISRSIDTEEVMAWKNGYFKFNEGLESIMNKIARWYNVEVVYEAAADPGQKFGGKILRSKDISSVLRIMESTGNVHFKIEGRRVTVMK